MEKVNKTNLKNLIYHVGNVIEINSRKKKREKTIVNF